MRWARRAACRRRCRGCRPGRPDRDAADREYELRKGEVEEAPDDWRCWYRLALAYGDAGDSKRGRAAMRHAIALRRAGE